LKNCRTRIKELLFSLHTLRNSSLKQVLCSKCMSKNTQKNQAKKLEELPEVSKEFLRGNEKLCKNILKNKKSKGGPYSKTERQTRRNEVYRLHFEYGYSAVKISEFLKINRNTINGDISNWYRKIGKGRDVVNPGDFVIEHIERLNLLRTRLREYLDESSNLQEKLAVERQILDVESKIGYTVMKAFHSQEQFGKQVTHWLNKWMKENKKEARYISYGDYLRVPGKSYEKIRHLIKEG